MVTGFKASQVSVQGDNSSAKYGIKLWRNVAEQSINSLTWFESYMESARRSSQKTWTCLTMLLCPPTLDTDQMWYLDMYLKFHETANDKLTFISWIIFTYLLYPSPCTVKCWGQIQLAFLDQMSGLSDSHALTSKCLSDIIYPSFSGHSPWSVSSSSLAEGSRSWLCVILIK